VTCWAFEWADLAVGVHVCFQIGGAGEAFAAVGRGTCEFCRVFCG
jgi:hypothetical protein